ncbi:hypothetical protein BDP27DRAFT_1361637 [Rhodocollybia butyracea]|uniref:Uncharacterized protein n=1 Tax=Rhodocollybia butyracea TaxID=206335 RepID=A0A9P5PYR5_9AGAR|nr:hypothetical protein BDP27DRAFT_1361637 [Rhodocollybia butyracea]
MSMLPNMPASHTMPQPIIGRPASPSGFSRSSDGLPYTDFQIEKSSKSPPAARKRTMMPVPQVDDEFAFNEATSKLLGARTRLSTISGLIQVDSSQLVLFFRTKSGITHSLDFPIDVDLNSPPALGVLTAACRPHQTSDYDDYSENESLFYPPGPAFPLTTSLEIANQPILDAIRSSLFPLLPQGHYLTVTRDKLEMVVKGGRMGPQPRTLRNDGRVATIAVTLPVRFRGGKFLIRDAEGHEEKYFGRGGKDGDMEWVAFTVDCEYEVETVTKGCRLTILYGVYLKTFGPTGLTEPLINPSDKFLDLISPVLNMSRGRKIGIYITNDYGVNPSEVLAESLVPMLKGGDALLYHAIKLYKLTPELHWTAGGYIWPVDRTVEIGEQGQNMSPSSRLAGLSLLETPRGRGAIAPVRGVFSHPGSARAASANGSAYPDPGEEEIADALRFRVEQSGAIPLVEAEIHILNDWNNPAPLIGKERVPFVVGGELDKLVVNTLIVLSP